MVDYVGRFETLGRDWDAIRCRMNCQSLPPLPRSMRSFHRPYQDYYSRDMREIVEEIYHCDIQRFGYTFE